MFFYPLKLSMFDLKKTLRSMSCDVRRKGWGYAHIWEMGVSMALYGDAATPRVFGLTNTEHTLLLIIKHIEQ